MAALIDDLEVRAILADDEGIPVVTLAAFIARRFGLDDDDAEHVAERVAGIVGS